MPRNQVVFRAGVGALCSRLIEGQFPSWRQLIPETFEHDVRLPREEFLEIDPADQPARAAQRAAAARLRRAS